jgi:hypothetical protein
MPKPRTSEARSGVSKYEHPPFTRFDRLRTGFETAFVRLFRANGWA